MDKDFTFDDLTSGGGAGAPMPAPQKDFLSSLVEFVNRAITLTSEINSLITNAKTNLVPLIAQKVQRELTPSGPGQNVAADAMTDPENIYKQILDGLVKLKEMLGDLPLSQVIEKMKENKGVVIAGLKAKIQAAKAGADGGPKK